MTHPLLPVAALQRWARRRVAGSVLCATLAAACGGGGGGDDAAGPVLQAPPTTAATLTQSGAEATASVQALHTGAAAILSKNAALDAGSLFAPVGASASPAARNAREQALARDTVGCSELGLSACSGSVTFDYDFDAGATTLPAGSHLTLTFNNLSGSYEGSSFALSGALRTDFLTSIDLEASSLANARLRVTLDELAGTADGVSFEPASAVALYEFDAEGAPAVTIDGLRLSGLDGLTVTDASNYSAVDTRLRFAHWATSPTYVDVVYGNWTVSAGRPSLNSAATLTAGGSGSAAITVTASSQSQVVYRVDLSIGGSTTQYLVTADYSAGTPTYTVVTAPG